MAVVKSARFSINQIAQSVPLTPGTRIAGRFEIVAPIGAGSMGEVYQARDLTLNRDVALKLVSPSLATSEEHLARFQREARAVSALNHPNICTIYDIGQAAEADGRPYLVMELLRGFTLFEALTSGPLAIPTVVLVGVQVAEALEAAHSAGIVHRDIKPANIFITSRGSAKLLDFGLAAVAQAAEASASLTNPGTSVGTVLYMSPEQALGDPLDARTDIFSLGVVLYEMLTGRRAFEGRSTTAIVDAILHSTPQLDAPGATSIPKPLRQLIARMFDKDKNRRPASAAEVAAHLRAIQSGSIAGREYAAATEESSSGSADPSGLWIGSDIFRKAPEYIARIGSSSGLTRTCEAIRFRDVGPLSLALLVLLVALYTGYSRFHGATPSLTSREPLLLADFANTTGEPVFDGALKDALEIQLQQSPYLNVLPASQIHAALQLMQRPANEPLSGVVAHDLCQRLGAKAVLLGSIAPLDSAYVIKLEAQACGSGDYVAGKQVQAASKTEVLPSVGSAAAQLRKELGESLGSIQRFNVPVQDATTASLEALKAYSMGIETRNRIGDAQAIPLFERALALDPNFALAAARLASIYANLSDTAKAQEYMKRAFERSEALSEPERLFITSSYHYLVTGRLDAVVTTYQLWISTYPQDWVPHNNLSSAYMRLNQFEAAVREAQAAVRLAPNTVVPYQQLGRSLLVSDRIDEAKAALGSASARSLDSSFNRVIAYDLAFLEQDAARMREHLDTSAARVDGYLIVTEAARAALASGEIGRSRDLYARAIADAREANIMDYAGSLLAEQAIADGVLGDRARALDRVHQALAVSRGIETTWTAALGAAFAGQTTEAARLASTYQRLAPPAADVVNGVVPMLNAAVSIANNNPRTAVDLLEGATTYERSIGIFIPYLRGLALRGVSDHKRAATEFRKVIARRGSQPTSLLHTLARLQLARALRASGDTAAARQAYTEFTTAWARADNGLPLMTEAMREAAALK
jgi:serine/threonine protein kinase/tetratricopeptide (TPR) repeat protein